MFESIFKVKNIKNKFYFFTVMISATLHVNISLCAHSVMKGVTFGISEIPVMLPVRSSCLTMVPLYFLLLLCLFGVRTVVCIILEFSSIVMFLCTHIDAVQE